MKLIKLLTVFMICIPTFSSKVQLNRNKTKYLDQCVVEVVNYLFTDDTDIMIVTSSVRKSASFAGDILELLEGNKTRAVTLKSLDTVSYGFQKYYYQCNYIIETRNQIELNSIIEVLRGLPSWHPRAEFLIISLEAFEKPHASTFEFNEILWRKDIIKASVFIPEAKNNSLYRIYSWQAFKQSNYDQNIVPTAYCSFGMLQNKTPWPREALSKCSHNCIFKAHYIDWPPLVSNANMGLQPSNYVLSQGFDMNLLNMIANKLNLTVFYNTTGILWGKVFENGTIEGSFELLLNRTVDILIGGYTKTADRITYFDLTDSHIDAFQEWCVSHTPVMMGIRSMNNIFSIDVWVLAISVYFLVCACIYVSNSYNQDEFQTYRNVNNTLFASFAIFLGVSIRPLPRGTSTRYFMTVLIISGFYLTLYYSGYLTSIISAPKYVQKYNTLKDIYDYKLKTYFMNDDMKWILNDSSITSIVPTKLIRKRWRSCYNMTWCFESVATSKATSFYTSNLHKDYFLASHSYTMHCMRYNKIGTPVTMVLRKGFPFFKQFNSIINRIIEAGIVVKWRKDIFKPKIPIHDKGNPDARIKFNNLIPLFKFLLVGDCISLVVFLIELLTSVRIDKFRQINITY